jgi:metal-sulfur cluster biosynthetic enzyme
VSLRARVLDALATVRDPELDEPITELRFVTACEVSPAGDVEVRLRLPTPQCAPNFAYLMAADAQAAIRRLPQVRGVSVTLEDHYTGDEINAAVGNGGGFTEAFPGESDDDHLDALRALFQRKAFVARQASLCERLLATGESPEQVTARHVGDLDDSPEARRCLELRGRLGADNGPGAAAFVRPDGAPIAAGELRRWLRTASLIRISLEVNGGICRSLLERRYALSSREEVAV